MSSDEKLRRASHAKTIEYEEDLPSPEEHQEAVEEQRDDDVVIEFKNVTKTYRLYKDDRGRFLGLFNFGKEHSLVTVTNACNDLSFKIHRGEAVALLGRNGAGKSTTLKMITGVVHPTSGEVTVKGRVSALLELTAGFDSKLTGRENISLRGQIVGLTQEQIAEIEPQVVEFAELGAYIDQPLRTYSSGMRSRLGFAFAVAVAPEILVVDEALSVGDRAFQKKCINRIREIMTNQNVTVLFVTHTSSTAKEFCKRGLVLDHGSLVFDGGIAEATQYYNDHFLLNIQDKLANYDAATIQALHDYLVASPNMLQDTDIATLQKKDAPYNRYRSIPGKNFATSWFGFAKQKATPPEEGIKCAFQWTIKPAAGVLYKAFCFYSTPCLELHEGTQYTIGCWVYCSVNGGTRAALQLFAPQGTYPSSCGLGRLYFELSEGWQYIAATFTCTESRTNYQAYFGCLSRGVDAIQRVCGFALAEGAPALQTEDQREE